MATEPRMNAPSHTSSEASPIGIVLVDDSAVVRGMITRALQQDVRFELLATAADGKMAIEVVKRTQPDIVLLDLEMPEMDGLTALPKLFEASPLTKVIVVCTRTANHAEQGILALRLGASEVLAKPDARDAEATEAFFQELRQKIKVLAGRSKSSPIMASTPPMPAPPPVMLKPTMAESAAAAPSAPLSSPSVTAIATSNFVKPQAIAIASSTGGPQALLTLFESLRGTKISVPIFITQHMPESFTTSFAEHLSKAAGVPCHEAKHGEEVRAGVLYLAPGDYHMTLHKQLHQVVVQLNQDPPENFCRPAADPMLRSLVPIYGNALMCLVLTGMGSDGMLGAKEVVRAGGYVAAQDRASSVVWGMPKAVAEAQLAHAVLPLKEIGELMARAMR